VLAGSAQSRAGLLHALQAAGVGRRRRQFFAEVVSIGRTSITVRVEVYAERHPAQPITVKVTEAVLTDVAVNQHGEKRELPSAE
jgi:acyl-CoA hydrolase